ncbi:protein kinase, partial [bacterium]|nr:protein kinase [bacterium]
ITNGHDFDYQIKSHLLGVGGSSEVYLVKDEGLGRLVAVKLFYPNYQLSFLEDMEGALRRQDIQEEYGQEIQSLCGIKHKNIIRLIDADSFLVSELVDLNNLKYDKKNKKAKSNQQLFPLGYRIHYIVTEYVPGVILTDYLSKFSPNREKLLLILSQIARAVEYINTEKKILHCDIKGSNILVDPDKSEVTLIDFALARNMNLSDLDDIKIFGYAKNFPKVDRVHPLYEIINNVDCSVKRGVFKEHAFPFLDIYHFGILLRSCVLEDVFGRDDVFYLNMVADRCMDFLREKWFYKSMDDVAYDIEKLLTDYESPHRIKGLGECVRGQHVIQLPNHHNSVHFSGKIKSVIDTSYFQRLRSVYQLDLCHMTFPGATHTRFMHSLHCYQLMGDLLVKLASDRVMRIFMSEKFVDLALFAALLHDIFHFPFLHVIEEIGGVLQKNCDCLSEIELMLIRKKGEPDLEGVLDSIGINVNDLWGIINGWTKIKHEKENMLIHSMIDGGVDLDKISYLYYDSYFTGVPDGVGMDINKLIRSSVITKVGGGEKYVLAWKLSGLSSLEQVVLARYQMFKKVYWNSDNRSVIARVKYVFSRLLVENAIHLNEYVEQNAYLNQNAALLYMNELYKLISCDYSPLDGIILPKRETMYVFSSAEKNMEPIMRRCGIPDNDSLIEYTGESLINLS